MVALKDSKTIHQTIKFNTRIKILKLIKVTSHILMRKSLPSTKEMTQKNNGETKIRQNKILI